MMNVTRSVLDAPFHPCRRSWSDSIRSRFLARDAELDQTSPPRIAHNRSFCGNAATCRALGARVPVFDKVSWSDIAPPLIVWWLVRVRPAPPPSRLQPEKSRFVYSRHPASRRRRSRPHSITLWWLVRVRPAPPRILSATFRPGPSRRLGIKAISGASPRRRHRPQTAQQQFKSFALPLA